MRDHRLQDGFSGWAVPYQTHGFSADDCDGIEVVLRAPGRTSRTVSRTRGKPRPHDRPNCRSACSLRCGMNIPSAREPREAHPALSSEWSRRRSCRWHCPCELLE